MLNRGILTIFLSFQSPSCLLTSQKKPLFSQITSLAFGIFLEKLSKNSTLPCLLHHLFTILSLFSPSFHNCNHQFMTVFSKHHQWQNSNWLVSRVAEQRIFIHSLPGNLLCNCFITKHQNNTVSLFLQKSSKVSNLSFL